MADDELKIYPGGQISFGGGGDLQDATSASFDVKNNSKLVHTLRLSPAGVQKGVLEATGTIDLVVSEDGPEREYVAKAMSGEKVSALYKFALLDVSFNGVIDGVSGELKTGEASTMKVTLVGKISL